MDNHFLPAIGLLHPEQLSFLKIHLNHPGLAKFFGQTRRMENKRITFTRRKAVDFYSFTLGIIELAQKHQEQPMTRLIRELIEYLEIWALGMALSTQIDPELTQGMINLSEHCQRRKVEPPEVFDAYRSQSFSRFRNDALSPLDNYELMLSIVGIIQSNSHRVTRQIILKVAQYISSYLAQNHRDMHYPDLKFFTCWQEDLFTRLEQLEEYRNPSLQATTQPKSPFPVIVVYGKEDLH